MEKNKKVIFNGGYLIIYNKITIYDERTNKFISTFEAKMMASADEFCAKIGYNMLTNMGFSKKPYDETYKKKIIIDINEKTKEEPDF